MSDRNDITLYFKRHYGKAAEIVARANQVAAATLPPDAKGNPATATDLLAEIANGAVEVTPREAQPEIKYHQFQNLSFPQLIQLAATALQEQDRTLAEELRKRGAALLEAVS